MIVCPPNPVKKVSGQGIVLQAKLSVSHANGVTSVGLYDGDGVPTTSENTVVKARHAIEHQHCNVTSALRVMEIACWTTGIKAPHNVSH